MSRLHPTSALRSTPLTKARLVEIASGFEIDIARSKAKFIDGIATSKRASFEKVLEASA